MIVENFYGTLTAMKTLTRYFVLVLTFLYFFTQYTYADEAFFLPFSMYGTRNVNIKVDTLGGKHVAYGEWNGDGVHYGFCATNCELPENWTMTEVFNSNVNYGSEPSRIQLQLTPSNNPRIGFEVNGYSTQSNGYYYAECNQNCLDATNWNTVNFVEAGKNITGDCRWLKLNAQGYPRAITIYTEDANYLEDKRVTLYYNSCDNNCTELNNWTSSPITTWPDMGLTPYMLTSLELTSTDWPRLGVYAQNSTIGSNGEHASLYFECNGACDNFDNWSWVYLQDQWTSQFDLTLDKEDRVRVATYSAGTIAYSKCDDSCLAENSWQKTTVPGLSAESGYYVSLIFDESNRPHMAYTINSCGSQVDYLYCADGCDSFETSNWTSIKLEDTNPLGTIPFINNDCSYQAWCFDGPVSLALDDTNNAILGYSSSNWQGMYCVDKNVSVSSVLHRGRIGHVTVSTTPRTLTVLKAGNGFGKITSNPTGIDCGDTCSTTFENNTLVTLLATPEEGSFFSGWSGECSGTEKCTVSINGDKTVEAIFARSSSVVGDIDDDGSITLADAIIALQVTINSVSPNQTLNFVNTIEQNSGIGVAEAIHVLRSIENTP